MIDVCRLQSLGASPMQHTLRSPVEFHGNPLFYNLDAHIVIAPAEPGTGIRFVVNHTEIPVEPSSVTAHPDRPKAHSTCLGLNGLYIITTEHLLGALAGLGIDNATIFSNGFIPWLDGSARGFAEKIMRAGLEDQGVAKQVYRVEEPFSISVDDARAVVRPPTRPTLRVSAIIHFPPPIGTQQYGYEHSPITFALNIAPARSFNFAPFQSDAATRARLPGVPLRDERNGAANLITWNETGLLCDRRMPEEEVRHKILDFLGDMILAGVQLHADVQLTKPSHRLNRALATRVHAAVGVMHAGT